MTQIEQAQKLLQKLKEDIKSAERQRDIAENIANDAESRKREILGNIEAEANVKRQLLETETADLKAVLKQETDKAKTVKEALLDEIVSLNKEKSKLETDINDSSQKKHVDDEQLKASNEKLAELDAQIIDKTEEVVDLRGKIDSLMAQIKDLEDSKLRTTEDLEILDNEANQIEEKIIELDGQFKARKEVLDTQLSEVQLKLRKAVDDLQEAQNKDKTMRQAWADERMRLDEREKVVRRMEARVSDAESRIEELRRYDVL